MRRARALLVLLALAMVVSAPEASAVARSQKFPCKVVGVATLDPIVNPDGSPSMHEHMFIGNKGVPLGVHDYEEAIAQVGTCNFPGDTAAYWWPSLRKPDGSLVPAKGVVYYDKMTSQRITAFPADFGAVWGYNRGVFNPKPRSYFGWNCDNTQPLQPNFSMVDCRSFSSSSNVLTLRTFSPYCWDGVDPGTRDFGAHVFYPVGYPKNDMCPAGAIVLPRIRVNANFQVKYCPDCVLASDEQYGTTDGASAHVDFWNTWDQSALEGLVAQLNA